MSSRTPDNGGDSPGEPERIWHPAHEWLEEDELDSDYHPPQEPEDNGGWEAELPIEDEALDSEYDDDGKISSQITQCGLQNS
jgi:WD repeat-containing protein 23